MVSHVNPSRARSCSGGQCCQTCGFVCHRHWMSRYFPRGIRRGENMASAWGRQGPETTGYMMPESIQRLGAGLGPTTFAYTVPTPATIEPPRITNTSRRNMSYDTVVRGRTAPNARPQAGDPLITDEQIMDALNEPF